MLRKHGFKAAILFTCMLLALTALGQAVAAQGLSFDVDAGSAILVDAATGQVLFEKNADEPLPPASMVKVMTMLIVMEEIAAGRAKLTDPVAISARAEGTGGSQVWLAQREVFTVEELLKAVAIQSANDAAVALAEHFSGTVEAFVDVMNRRAQELGMKKTYFANPDGLPSEPGEPPTVATARDLTLDSREILKYPQVLEWTSTVTSEFRKDQTTLYNTNKLIGKYPGLDGLKTGYTQEAGFCLTATAQRGDLRLISVVMNTQSDDERQVQTTRLLDYGFRNFERVMVVPEGEVVATLQVRNGWPGTVSVAAGEELRPLVIRGGLGGVVKEVQLSDVSAPLKKGDQVGVIIAKEGDRELGRIPAVVTEDVGRANFVVVFFRWLKDLIFGLFR